MGGPEGTLRLASDPLVHVHDHVPGALGRCAARTGIPTAPPPAPVQPAGARADASAAPPRSWLRGLVRGREADPAWVRPGSSGLLVATAVLYLWGLGASGWANSFYSAAVQAGSQSWKAFFFGSSDAANFITVDKPPASLWVMELSVRIFGLNSWSILVPEALEGVAVGRRALRHRAALVRRRRPACSPARCWRSRRSPR